MLVNSPPYEPVVVPAILTGPFRAAVVDPFGRLTQVDVNRFSQVTTWIDPAGYVTNYTYTNNAELIGIDDPMGHHTSMSYDAKGNLSGVSFPDGGSVSWSHDQYFSQVLEKYDLFAGRTCWTYNQWGSRSRGSMPGEARPHTVITPAPTN